MRGPRRGRVNRLLEERPIERIGLVEERRSPAAGHDRPRLRVQTRGLRRTARRQSSRPRDRAARGRRANRASWRIRISAAASSSRVSARMTPRLPESGTGLTTAGSRCAVRASTVATGIASSTDLEGRAGETIVAEPLPRLRLVTAPFDRHRRVPFEAESPRRVCGKDSRPVADRDHAVRRRRQRSARAARSDCSMLVEPHRDRPIAPRDPRDDRSCRTRSAARRQAAGAASSKARIWYPVVAAKRRTRAHGQIRAACPSVGSAQQYQGSVRYGTRGLRAPDSHARLVSA